MKLILMLLTLCCLPCLQAQSSTGTAKSQGTCSIANTGTITNATINCPGVSRQQLEKLLGVMNRILDRQLDPDAVMTLLQGMDSKIDGLSSDVRQIKETPQTVNNCPGGLCISGGTVENPTVINNGPPPPTLDWKQEQSTDDDGTSTTTVSLTVDRTMEIGAFGAVCERACRTSKVDLLVSTSLGGQSELSIPGMPTFVGIAFEWPRPFGAGLRVKWSIKATDGEPLKLLNVAKVSAKDVMDAEAKRAK